MVLRWSLLFVLIATTPARAQQPVERLPWAVSDFHLAWVGVPTAEGRVPVVPADTPLPGRGRGMGAGVTIYPVKLGKMTLGIGGSFLTGSGTSSALTETTPATPGTTTTAATLEVIKPVTTIVTTKITSLMPQLSINFGRRLGWSYLSAGIGRSKVASTAAAFRLVPQQSVAQVWESALNFGGGARWFMKTHLGAGFDVRFVQLPSRTATELLPVSGKRTRNWTISGGISIQ